MSVRFVYPHTTADHPPSARNSAAGVEPPFPASAAAAAGV